MDTNGVWTATWNPVANASGYRFCLAGSGWHDCIDASYTFQNPPQTADYEVYALGDGISFTDSDVTKISYPESNPEPEPEPEPVSNPEPEPEPVSNPEPVSDPEPQSESDPQPITEPDAEGAENP